MAAEVSIKARDSKRETASEVEALGGRLKSARLAAHLTLDQLAGRSGVSRAMLSKVERGEKSPTLSIISRIARGQLLLDLLDGRTFLRKGSNGKQPQHRCAGCRSGFFMHNGYLRHR